MQGSRVFHLSSKVDSSNYLNGILPLSETMDVFFLPSPIHYPYLLLTGTVLFLLECHCFRHACSMRSFVETKAVLLHSNKKVTVQSFSTSPSLAFLSLRCSAGSASLRKNEGDLF